MDRGKWRLLCASAACLMLAAGQAAAGQAAYDPLEAPAGATPRMLDFTVSDADRGRDIPIRVFLPPEKRAAPVVLFSHGLGGSRAGSAFLGRHWAARGYAVVYVQHPGSDEAVWLGKPAGERLAAMRRAAGIENFLLRVRDIPAVLDRLEAWNRRGGHALEGRLDPGRVGMSGHSFGAVTTQAVSGQAAAGGLLSFTEARIRAAVAFSPSSPRGTDPRQAFGGVRIPWMLMTGTRDIAAIGDVDLASRLAVFPALPPGGKYELVLDGAEHSAFTERALPGESGPRNPNHHRAILALSTAFWDAHLSDLGTARQWLDGDGPAAVLEPKDRWQRK